MSVLTGSLTITIKHWQLAGLSYMVAKFPTVRFLLALDSLIAKTIAVKGLAIQRLCFDCRVMVAACACALYNVVSVLMNQIIVRLEYDQRRNNCQAARRF